MNELRAVLWDVDGTLAETERDGHRVAFNLTFEHFGFDWRWSEARYGELLGVSGGRERLLADFDTHDDVPAGAAERKKLAREMHQQKNRFYADIVRQGHLQLRRGVIELMDECDAHGVVMGITTTTSRSNLQALLDAQLGTAWPERFAAVVVGEDVKHKKPDPEVFDIALRELDLEPHQVVAIEDAPAGVIAARSAGVPVLVTRSTYFADAPMQGARAIGPGLHTRSGWRPAAPDAHATHGIGLADVAYWHAGNASISQPG